MSDEKIDLVIDNDREWRKLLLDQNKELSEKVDKINDNFATKAKNDERRLTKLEIKSGFWGLVGGILSFLGIHVWK